MEKPKRGDLALKLSVEVLESTITYDEGLVRAKSLNLLEPFVEGLNILVGREMFVLEEARHRLRSGEAERATKGEAQPYELPAELEGWTLGGDNRPPLDPDLFAPLETRVQQLLSERQEIEGRLRLVEAAMRAEESVPSPWPGPAVVLVLTFSIALISYFQFGSMLSMALALGVGSVICLAVFRTAMQRFESENHRVRMAVRKRAEKRQVLQQELSNQDNHIEDVRAKADAIFDRAAPPSEEELETLPGRFPGLFPRK